MKVLKNIAVAAACILALAPSAFAKEPGLMNIQVGYSSNEVTANGTSEGKQGGPYTCFDLMGTTASGLGFGVGFDINAWGANGGNGVSEGKSFYTMGATAKIGYTLQPRFGIPLKIKGGYGYGLMDIGVHDAWGPQYEGGVEYRLFEKFGVGIKYKHAKADILGTTIENAATITYITIGD